MNNWHILYYYIDCHYYDCDYYDYYDYYDDSGECEDLDFII